MEGNISKSSRLVNAKASSQIDFWATPGPSMPPKEKFWKRLKRKRLRGKMFVGIWYPCLPFVKSAPFEKKRVSGIEEKERCSQTMSSPWLAEKRWNLYLPNIRLKRNQRPRSWIGRILSFIWGGSPIRFVDVFSFLLQAELWGFAFASAFASSIANTVEQICDRGFCRWSKAKLSRVVSTHAAALVCHSYVWPYEVYAMSWYFVSPSDLIFDVPAFADVGKERERENRQSGMRHTG